MCISTPPRPCRLKLSKAMGTDGLSLPAWPKYVLQLSTTTVDYSMLFWHQTCHAATCRNQWHWFPKLPIGGNGVEYSHVSFHLGIDLVLMLMSETARNKHGSPAVTRQWLVCTPNISQFLLLGMAQMAGFHGLGERSRKPYRSSAASCLAQRKNKSSWYGYGSSLGTQYFDGFCWKTRPNGVLYVDPHLSSHLQEQPQPAGMAAVHPV